MGTKFYKLEAEAISEYEAEATFTEATPLDLIEAVIALTRGNPDLSASLVKETEIAEFLLSGRLSTDSPLEYHASFQLRLGYLGAVAFNPLSPTKEQLRGIQQDNQVYQLVTPESLVRVFPKVAEGLKALEREKQKNEDQKKTRAALKVQAQLDKAKKLLTAAGIQVNEVKDDSNRADGEPGTG